jgi:hypothetical protein
MNRYLTLQEKEDNKIVSIVKQFKLDISKFGKLVYFKYQPAQKKIIELTDHDTIYTTIRTSKQGHYADFAIEILIVPEEDSYEFIVYVNEGMTDKDFHNYGDVMKYLKIRLKEFKQNMFGHL